MLDPALSPGPDTSTTEPLVRAVGISKVFGRGEAAVTALAEATFEIREGQMIAVTGPSGSGKSTLLHLVAALDRPTEGVIEWPALGAPDLLRPGPVSFSFQGPSLLPPLTVLENVALPMLLAGAEREVAEKAALEVIHRLDLAEVGGKLPEELSGGQSQRAGVARSLVGSPRLILADEPTGQQDRASGQRVLDAMMRAARVWGAALMVATHDQRVADQLLHRWNLRDRRLDTGVTLRSR
jgi:ABC-type lipoprotein export system ATPase subunit